MPWTTEDEEAKDDAPEDNGAKDDGAKDDGTLPPEKDPTVGEDVTPPPGDAPPPPVQVPPVEPPKPSEAAQEGLNEAFVFSVDLVKSVAHHLAGYPNKMQAVASDLKTFMDNFAGKVSAAKTDLPTAGADAPNHTGPQP